jgi:hypothetical protein
VDKRAFFSESALFGFLGVIGCFWKYWRFVATAIANIALYLNNFTAFDNQKGGFVVIVFSVNVEHFWRVETDL